MQLDLVVLVQIAQIIERFWNTPHRLPTLCKGFEKQSIKQFPTKQFANMLHFLPKLFFFAFSRKAFLEKNVIQNSSQSDQVNYIHLK